MEEDTGTFSAASCVGNSPLCREEAGGPAFSPCGIKSPHLCSLSALSTFHGCYLMSFHAAIAFVPR